MSTDDVVKIATVCMPIALAAIAYMQFRYGKKADAAAIATAEERKIAGEEREEVRKTAESAAEKVEEVKSTLETTSTVTNEKLDVIHTLVNSQLSSALKGELDGLIRERLLMLELSNGRVEALAAIKSTEFRISELQQILKERTKQQELIDSNKII